MHLDHFATTGTSNVECQPVGNSHPLTHTLISCFPRFQPPTKLSNVKLKEHDVSPTIVSIVEISFCVRLQTSPRIKCCPLSSSTVRLEMMNGRMKAQMLQNRAARRLRNWPSTTWPRTANPTPAQQKRKWMDRSVHSAISSSAIEQTVPCTKCTFAMDVVTDYLVRGWLCRGHVRGLRFSCQPQPTYQKVGWC